MVVYILKTYPGCRWFDISFFGCFGNFPKILLALRLGDVFVILELCPLPSIFANHGSNHDFVVVKDVWFFGVGVDLRFLVFGCGYKLNRLIKDLRFLVLGCVIRTEPFDKDLFS